MASWEEKTNGLRDAKIAGRNKWSERKIEAIKSEWIDKKKIRKKKIRPEKNGKRIEGAAASTVLLREGKNKNKNWGLHSRWKIWDFSDRRNTSCIIFWAIRRGYKLQKVKRIFVSSLFWLWAFSFVCLSSTFFLSPEAVWSFLSHSRTTFPSPCCEILSLSLSHFSNPKRLTTKKASQKPSAFISLSAIKMS